MRPEYFPAYNRDRTPEERFWEKVERIPSSECWFWIAPLNSGGYGTFYWKGKRVGAHRAAYELFRGPIPDDREIDHLCRNRDCVNPDHLDLVTHRENLLRGRTTPAAAIAGHARRDVRGRFA